MTDKSGLMKRTGVGVLWMVIGSGGQTLFQFVLFMILARLLGPEAFGVVGIATAFIDISNLIGRAGLTEVLVQRAETSEEELDTAFWSSFGFGLLLTVVMFLTAQNLADLFGVAELKQVMQWLAPMSLLFAAGTVYEAKLRREFGFRALAARNVSATIVSGVVAMVMAFTGFGVFSLVAQRLIYYVWFTAAMIVATRWWPSLRFRPRIAVAQLKGGIAVALSSLLGSGNQRVLDLIVGYFVGAEGLGYLRIAWRGIDLLLELSIRPVTTVTLTSLARLQNDRPALIDTYLQLVHMTAAFLYPLFVGAALVAPELLTLMFGVKWQASILPMQILTQIALFVPLIWYKTNILMAIGRMWEVLLINLFEFAASVIVGVIAAQYSVEGAAFGNVVRMLLATPVILFAVKAWVGVPFGRTLAAVMYPAAATVIMAGALLLLRPHLGTLHPIVILAIMSVVGFAIYAPAILAVDRTLWRTVRNVMSTRTRRPEPAS
ncbi:lipopolysaccharide biosynthesis protein [Bradyrhizobium sp. 44]|uniref:lipopolysaccharide biosynthesis protein n=1 Tax=Bradyrhizobium sp. 44 TaxID=2782675 RepID=UPI001FF936EC|nr:lipopolysaccharide biosynthesis protein [Bradyrhizobium sp. 44]MCK1284205.1 lipopolysaccharide biosynthesis protein [Bradyrhizobium sp. 44]